ncbi:hypothetical protein SY88_15475 [Clostridiales bacterium PH28_bin88]|nr:hypothetical protein SY88_15475 [Clostridiales bacterium PH28_bin88]
MGMNIVVCVKQILDPEVPPQDFQIDPVAKVAVRGKASLVMSTFDEIGVEVALKLRERAGGAKITALTLGPKTAEEILRKSLAMLVDEAVHIRSEDLGYLDSFATAALLAAGIRSIGPVDLVVCGRQAGDTDAGQVGLLLAEELGLPTITSVTEVEPQGDVLHFRREGDRGVEIVECAGPVAITVTNSETNVPRIPKVKDIMASHRKPVKALSISDLNMSKDIQGLIGTEVAELFIPVRENKCEIIPGEEPEELADSLVRRLMELKVL